MPGPICKVIVDAGRLIAASLYLIRMAKSTAKMIGEAILRGALKGDDLRVTVVNDKLCYWAEKVEAWNVELFALASEIAASPPAERAEK